MKKIMITAITSIVALSIGTTVFAADIYSSEKDAKLATVAKRVNINTATEEQLKSLPGVGEGHAKKIIAGRPYTRNEQLKTKEIIPADLYAKIQKLLASIC